MRIERQGDLDALKVLASQLIVLHHLATYGPVADAVGQILPGHIDWLYDYGRMAVQVFLVLGGFLAVQHLMPTMKGPATALGLAVWSRYLRLVPPFAVAMVLAIAAAAWARPWLDTELAGAPPELPQVISHLLLLHGLLDVESLSAGLWYVAIDFQLYVLLASLLWLSLRGGSRILAMGAVLLTCAASLLIWNRQPAIDDWALYFFGAYGLGAMAHWASAAATPGLRRTWLAGLALLGILALLTDFRTRLALALVVALWLAHKPVRWPEPPPVIARPLATLGRSSYALFLVHFPVLLIGNAWFVRSELTSPVAGLTTFFAIWIFSILLGWIFERRVEAPLIRFFRPGSHQART